MGLLQRIREWFAGAPREPEAAPPPPDMHWRPTVLVAEVACGVDGIMRWTGDGEALREMEGACPECRRSAELRAITRLTNYR